MRRPARFSLVTAMTILFAGAAEAQDSQERSEGGGAQLLVRLDADGNGSVSRAEFAGATDRVFGAVDRDGDGAISMAEFAAFDRNEGVIQSADARAERFALIDSDGDGLISRPELHAQQERRFEMVDRDGSGEITPDELGRRR